MKEFNLNKLRKKDPDKLTLEEVNALARAENLSYGKYCAKHNLYKNGMKG